MSERKTSKLDALPQFQPVDRADWRHWLAANHAQSTGVWLVTWKQAGLAADRTRVAITYDDGVEEALCFGWVDSLGRGLDDQRTMLLYTPRKPKSAWSAPNKRRVAALLEAGLMAPAGLSMVTLAKETGTWEALDAVEALEIPEDLGIALDALPPARANFEVFPKSVKRGILDWIRQAKRPETRAERVRSTATLAERNERAAQWKPKA